jgi:flagellar motility protein MotE (MotC chaperone)
MNLAPSPPWPGWKFLPAALAGGLLLKIAVSGVYLAPPTWWTRLGPTVSEAATHAGAKPEHPPSLARLFTLVQQERQSLKVREEAVAVKEEHLRILQKEVGERLQELKALQLKMLDAVEEENRLKSEHNRHLVATLTAMPAERAAKLLEKMEEKSAVQLLRNLKGNEAGAILAVLAPEKAAQLSQRLLQ